MPNKLIITVIAILTFCRHSFADDIQILFPENNVSSKPIVEFRARRGIPGHAFVFLGKELDNGLTYFYGAAGFYPSEGKLSSIKMIASTPGKVTYKLNDIVSEEAFRVNITTDQEEAVQVKISEWNDKEYGLAWQNCVSLSRDVGRTLGLTVPEFNIASIDQEYPANFVSSLRAVNDKDTPIRFEERVRANENAARERKAVEAAQKALDDIENARKLLEQAEAARKAAEAVEAARKAVEQAEEARKAIEAAEAARKAIEQAEAARKAAEEAEAARRAAEAARPPVIPRIP